MTKRPPQGHARRKATVRALHVPREEFPALTSFVRGYLHEDFPEVHGSLRTSSCLTCGLRVPFEEIVRMLESQPAPPCPACTTILKPDVVMFGELLPERAIDRAFELARAAGLLLVVGSSLEVYPVAGLPVETLEAGGALAIVNRGPTPYDERATLKLDRGAGEVLSRVVAELG